MKKLLTVTLAGALLAGAAAPVFANQTTSEGDVVVETSNGLSVVKPSLESAPDFENTGELVEKPVYSNGTGLTAEYDELILEIDPVTGETIQVSPADIVTENGDGTKTVIPYEYKDGTWAALQSADKADEVAKEEKAAGKSEEVKAAAAKAAKVAKADKAASNKSAEKVLPKTSAVK